MRSIRHFLYVCLTDIWIKRAKRFCNTQISCLHCPKYIPFPSDCKIRMEIDRRQRKIKKLKDKGDADCRIEEH